MKHRTKPRRARCTFEVLEPRKLLSAGLAVTFNSSSSDVSGLSTLSYNGTTLIDDSIPQEQFQVARYYTLSNGVYTSQDGGSNFTHSWNAATDVLTNTYSWGTLTCQYVVSASRLTMIFGVNNSATSGVTLGGVVVYPAYVHLPYTIVPTDEQQIAGATNPAAPLWAPETAYGIDGPAVLPADYSNAPTNNGAVAALVNDGPATRQMYTALWSTNYNNSQQGVARPGQDYFIFAGTAPKDTMLSDQAASPTTYTAPITYTNTAPGQSDSFQISLRFGAAGTAPTALATDIEQNYAAAYPQQVNWPDTRPIASLHIASYSSTPTTTNPENWALAGYNNSPIDTTTTAGLNNFSAGVLSYAAGSMAEMTTDHSQGMIVWDLEGEKYAQPNPSYIGDPSLATTLAPEWNYNYQGNGPLINQFFAAYTNAGFRVGVTLRPTSIVFNNGVPSQTPNNGVGSVPIATEITNLENKIAYANSHWGCTLFYVDSTTGFDSAALRVVQQAYPNVLLIPEHQTISTFGTGVAYGELANDFVGTPANVLPTYPTAKSLIYIADGDMSTYASQLVSSLSRGDIMLFRAWFADPNNAVMRSDYSTAMAVPNQVSLVASAGDGVVNLSWGAGGPNAVYNIKRAPTSGGTYVQIASGVFGNTYADKTVTNYTSYSYIVTAVNGAGTGADSHAATATAVGPTVATAASASPSSVAGTSTTLSVLGTDMNGESSLTYTWAAASTPANAPPARFSVNGTNLAKNTTAYFYQAGTYLLTATITDPNGFSTTSSVTVTVNQTVQSLYVLPPKITLAQGGTQQYSVTGRDQYSDTINSPQVSWSVSGGGSISAAGLFTAGSTGGTYTVTAVSGAVTAVTSVTVQATAPALLTVAAIGIVPVQPINIGDSDLIVQNGGAAGLATVQAEIQQGEIISSAAGSDTTHLTAIGVMLNSNGNVGSPAAIYNSFDGLPTNLNDVLAKYTYYGDTNLDGKVDGSDYAKIDFGFLTRASGWSNGDFNGDGVINGSDYTLMDNAFNRQSTSLGGGSTIASAAAILARAVPATSTARAASYSAVFADSTISTSDNQSNISTLLDELHRQKSQLQ